MAQRVAALGLDVGHRRIGIAGCDGLGLMATGLTTLERSTFQADVAALRAIAQERQVTLLVMGLPYLLDGRLGAQAKQVQRFARGLSQALDLPIVFVDERLTSVAAEDLMRQAGQSLRDQKGLIDRKAAALILQQWLDEQRPPITAASEDNPDGRCAYLEGPR
jgi:putative holliday junction resolvase